MTETATPAVGSVNLLDLITKDEKLPKGCDSWAIRSVHPDGASSHGFVWPLHRKRVTAAGPCVVSDNPCPSAPGDGVCAAHTWRGMASGGIPAITLLLVAYATKDILAGSVDKVRLSACRVVKVIDGARLLREAGEGANLQYADLQGANLRDANLQGANLQGADLQYADLQYANLRYANLQYADLQGADLRYADLQYANLQGADPRYADLQGANLRSANLQGANLQGALDVNTTGAIL